MMTTKQKVINESIKRAKRRIGEIDSILDAEPLRDIIELRKEAQERLNQERENDNELGSEFMAYIKKMAGKEKELFKLIDKRQDYSKLAGEKINLENELRDLENEKFYSKG